MIERAASPLIVLKVGGRVGGRDGALSALPDLLRGSPGLPPCRVVIVHGGGPEISRWMERLALPITFKDGLRVTDPASLEVATMVLRGSVNTALVAALAAIGVSAVGLSGVDAGLLEAEPHPDPALGLVGQAGTVHPAVLHALLALGLVPVIAPLAMDAAGQVRNINADTACGAIAAALEARLAVFLTDVPGVLDAGGSVLPHLFPSQVESMIAGGEIHGGMVPKVRACLAALRHGARAACIADGRNPQTLPGLLVGATGYGTVIAAGPAPHGAEHPVP